MTYRERVDPITLELVRNVLESIVEEMALTIIHTARSSLVKESEDFGCGLFNGRGEIIATGSMGSSSAPCMLHLSIKAVCERYPISSMQLGDVFILNDPYEGGTHLPDIIVIKPIFWEDLCCGFAGNKAHHTDIGGRVPGGNASDSTEIYQEGLRIPPLKLYDKGIPNETIFRIIEKNVRMPDKVLGDLQSQVSACGIGEKGILGLVGKYGLEQFNTITDAILDYAEELTRAELRGFPDGEYEWADYLDDDGFDSGPIRLHVTLRKKGDSIIVDFSGTCPQVKGAINCDLGFTIGRTMTVLTTGFQSNPPLNAGFFRPITVVAPPGSVFNPLPPAPVAARGLTATRLEDLVWGAMAKMLPDRVFACGVGTEAGICIAGYYADGKPFAYLEFIHGSWGGRPGKDGIDGCTYPDLPSYSNAPVEILEVEQPFLIEEYGFVPNTGGAGKYRGGLAKRRSYRLTGADEAALQLRCDRQRFHPFGLWGGKPGTFGRDMFNPGAEERILPAKGMFTLKKGDLFAHVGPGAGGWGDPLEREPELVLDDVKNEKFTPDYVEREYGVVIDMKRMRVDYPATKRLRATLRDARKSEPQ